MEVAALEVTVGAEVAGGASVAVKLTLSNPIPCEFPPVVFTSHIIYKSPLFAMFIPFMEKLLFTTVPEVKL